MTARQSSRHRALGVGPVLRIAGRCRAGAIAAQVRNDQGALPRQRRARSCARRRGSAGSRAAAATAAPSRRCAGRSRRPAAVLMRRSAKPGNRSGSRAHAFRSSRLSALQPMSERQKPPGQSILANGAIGALLRFAHGLAARRDVEHAAAGGEQARSFVARCRRGIFRRLPRRRRRRGRGSRCPWRSRRDSRWRPSRQSGPHRRASAGRSVSSTPSAVATSAGSRSDLRRSISTCVSGSPKRTLYSISLGPLAVIISPANSTPLNGAPRVRHAADGRPDDLVHGALRDLRRHDRRRRIGAHAAGVGTFLAVEHALVVLGRDQRQRMRAVDERRNSSLPRRPGTLR